MEIVGIVQAMTAATRGNLLGQFEEEEAVEGEAEVPVATKAGAQTTFEAQRGMEREREIDVAVHDFTGDAGYCGPQMGRNTLPINF